jgi:hypothetical protein
MDMRAITGRFLFAGLNAQCPDVRWSSQRVLENLGTGLWAPHNLPESMRRQNNRLAVIHRSNVEIAAKKAQHQPSNAAG